MNLEDGEEGSRCDRVIELATRVRRRGRRAARSTRKGHGAHAERKLAIAKRIRDLAVDAYGLRDEDILFDPLVLPISTGIEEDLRRNALETIEGIRAIRREMPSATRSSVVERQLRAEARGPRACSTAPSCTSCARRADAAIVHAARSCRRTASPRSSGTCALDLIYDRRREGFDPLTHFIEAVPRRARDGASRRKTDRRCPVEEQLKHHIIDGESDGLDDHLDEALKSDSARSTSSTTSCSTA